MPPEQLRRQLRRQIDQARRARGVPAMPTVDVTCQVCGGAYPVTQGRAQVIARNGETPRCPECRKPIARGLYAPSKAGSDGA